MSVIYIVLPLALIFVIIALIVFARSVRAGQFDDLETPSVRILHDDEESSPGSGQRRTTDEEGAP